MNLTTKSFPSTGTDNGYYNEFKNCTETSSDTTSVHKNSDFF